MSFKNKPLSDVASVGVTAEQERVAQRFKKAGAHIETINQPIAVVPDLEGVVAVEQKPKVKRVNFTLPPNELDTLEKIRERLRMMNEDNTMSEVIRAGFIALSNMENDDLKVVFRQVEKIRR